MFRKMLNVFTDKCSILPYGFEFLFCVLLVFGMAACSDDDEPVVPEPEPDSVPAGFHIHIHMDKGNIIRVNEEYYPDYYPYVYAAYLVMEGLPADEKILYKGGCYSLEDREPDLSDYNLVYDETSNDVIQNWEWSEDNPLIWWCMDFYQITPGTTCYLRGYVKTDKGEYYSNTIEVRSNFTAPLQEDPDAYEIPVVFHLFPNDDGTYPVKDWMVKDGIAYANHVYSNYFNIPGQAKTGVRFVPVTHAPDGTLLETPGIVREREPLIVDYNEELQLSDQYIWDMEQVLNVWVCHIGGLEQTGIQNLGGFSYFPYFDEEEVMPGCNIYDKDLFSGIFLNTDGILMANSVNVFAHEAGHFLGLNHVFEEDYCDDTPWYDRDAFLAETGGALYFERWNNEQIFYSDNIMDYDFGFKTGFTPDQVERIQYTLRHAYFIPGEAGKEERVQVRSAGQARRFGTPVR